MVLLLLMVELFIDYFIQTFLSSRIFFDILFPNIFADFCSSIVFQFFSHSTWVLVVATTVHTGVGPSLPIEFAGIIAALRPITGRFLSVF